LPNCGLIQNNKNLKKFKKYLQLIFIKQKEVKFGESGGERRKWDSTGVFFKVWEKGCVSGDLVTWIL
jgi:hypothetical protein